MTVRYIGVCNQVCVVHVGLLACPVLLSLPKQALLYIPVESTNCNKVLDCALLDAALSVTLINYVRKYICILYIHKYICMLIYTCIKYMYVMLCVMICKCDADTRDRHDVSAWHSSGLARQIGHHPHLTVCARGNHCHPQHQSQGQPSNLSVHGYLRSEFADTSGS